MAKKASNPVFISDSGIIETNKKRHEKIFVFICRAISAFLAVLGVLAFVEGNF